MEALKLKPSDLDVAEAAKRFVPDPETIQWERRELDLRAAFAALEAVP